MILNPKFAVDVAVAFTLKPAKVVVRNPSVETDKRDLVDEPTAKPIRSPAFVSIPNLDCGEVVPRPTKPLLEIKKFVAVDEPTTNWFEA